jgi:hypothetical protein
LLRVVVDPVDQVAELIPLFDLLKPALFELYGVVYVKRRL